MPKTAPSNSRPEAEMTHPQNQKAVANAISDTLPGLTSWQDELDEVIGHLGAAITQSVATDDQIIMDHIRSAYEIAKIVRRRA
jgi:hypothetical protein